MSISINNSHLKVRRYSYCPSSHNEKTIVYSPNEGKSTSISKNTKRNSSISPIKLSPKFYKKSPKKRRKEDDYNEQIQSFLLGKFLALQPMDYMDNEEELLEEKEKEEVLKKRKNKPRKKSWIANTVHSLEELKEEQKELKRQMMLKLKMTDFKFKDA